MEQGQATVLRHSEWHLYTFIEGEGVDVNWSSIPWEINWE